MRIAWIGALLLLALASQRVASEEFNFPPPEFSQAYTYPQVSSPDPRPGWLLYVDLAVLAGTLGLAAWLALRTRNRRALAVLAVFSLLYFGFFRHGCICSVGSIQNVALVTVHGLLGGIAALTAMLEERRQVTPTQAGELTYQLRTILQQLKT